MSHFSTCEFGHPRPPLSGGDTTDCPICQSRRLKARKALGYPPTGPLQPEPAQIGDAAPDLPDMARRAA
jgi:hypothetical protein